MLVSLERKSETKKINLISSNQPRDTFSLLLTFRLSLETVPPYLRFSGQSENQPLYG
jgi:hypothetical protein